MIYKEDSVVINQSLPQVFEIASDIEKLSEFIPEYKNVGILNREGNRMELEARIKLLGMNIVFTSRGVIEPYRSIKYEQTKGPLRGLLTEWRFEQINEQTMQLTIIHQLQIKIPLIGNLISQIFYNLFIKGLAREVLVNMKKQAEKREDRP